MSEQDPQVPAPEPPAPGTPPDAGTPPPPAQPQWAPQGPSGPRAGFGRRLVALLVDGIILTIAFIVLWGIGIAISDAAATLFVLVSIVGYFAYYIVLEGGPTGQTIGKRALGIRVIDQNAGGQIGYGRGAIRLLARYLSYIACYLGYLWMLWDKEKQTWHDKLSTSVVVPVEYYPVSR